MKTVTDEMVQAFMAHVGTPDRLWAHGTLWDWNRVAGALSAALKASASEQPFSDGGGDA